MGERIGVKREYERGSTTKKIQNRGDENLEVFFYILPNIKILWSFAPTRNARNIKKPPRNDEILKKNHEPLISAVIRYGHRTALYIWVFETKMPSEIWAVFKIA